MPGLFDPSQPPDLSQQPSGGLLGNFQNNAPYVAQGQQNYTTQLHPLDEMAFRQWVGQNNVPFNPNQQMQDYDMRGFWQGLQQQNPHAMTAVNPNDQQLHYPDYWKTPYHQTFSGESKFAGPVAPAWQGNQLVAPSGLIRFDETKR